MFVEKLKRQDFEEILKPLGYKIDYNPTDQNLRYPIDLLTNSVMIRCVSQRPEDIQQQEMLNDIMNHLREKFNTSSNETNVDIFNKNGFEYLNLQKYKLIVFEDFFPYILDANDIDEEEHSQLFQTYIDYMSNKFPEYKTNLDIYVENLENEGKEPIE